MRSQHASRWFLVLSLIGIGLTGYLIYLHLGLLRGELLGGPVCQAAGPINCHVVTASAWGAFLGIPLSLWGLLGYVAVFGLALLARQPGDWSEHAVRLAFALSLVFVAVDLFLLGVMVFAIRFVCLFCMATWVVNVSLLTVSARALGRPWPEALQHLGASVSAVIPSGQRPAAWLFFGVLAVGVAGVAGIHVSTMFVSRGTLGSLQQHMREFIAKQPRVSVEASGDPTIGPSGAPIRIVEFSDFFCPACQRASKLNHIILSNHRNDVVFSFKHFPLDVTCNEGLPRNVHPGACQAAAASECAHLQGKFWPLHDVVFEKGHDYNLAHLPADAARLGLDMGRFNACMASGEGMTAVRRDVADGKRANVASTPTYIVNGIPIPGGLSPSMFEDLAAVLRDTSR